MLHRLACCLLMLAFGSGAVAQQKGPQPWWPTQPRPLPFVHSLFTDDMILQRDVAAPIWGWSTPGARIVVEVDGKQSGNAAVADEDGKSQTKIGTVQAGGPHTVKISGGEDNVTLKNVLFCGVWLCSGQSNMNWPVRLSNNAEEEVKNANYPDI